MVTAVGQKNKSRERVKVSKSSANVPGTRAQQENATREVRTKKEKILLGSIFFNKLETKQFRDEAGDTNDTKVCGHKTTTRDTSEYQVFDSEILGNINSGHRKPVAPVD